MPKAPRIHAKTVTMVPLADLKPYGKNARLHDDAGTEALAKVITDSGFTSPLILEPDGTIIAGHNRFAAAKLLGMTEVPAIRVSGLSKAQIRALRLSDNALGLRASWDEDLLRAELFGLGEIGFDLDLTGFPEDVLATLTMDVLDGVNDPLAEWRGMPGFQQGDKTAFRSLPVHFADQDAVDKFAELIGQAITLNTRFVWFPQIEIERYADKQYAAEQPAVSDLHSVEGAGSESADGQGARPARRPVSARRRAAGA